MVIRRSLAALFLFFSLTAHVWAAPYPIIVETAQGADIKAIVHTLHGRLLDELPGGTYLVSVNSLPPSAYSIPGVLSIEADFSARLGKQISAIVATQARNAPDWYRDQPMMKLIRADKALHHATGRGVLIADINSLVDYSHPALLGHLTGGYDFVIGRPSQVTLNQSLTGFLDQSSTAFLDQWLASFLNQSSAGFLDQSSSGFLDAINPARGHGTLTVGILAMVAPESMIMPLRVFDDQGQADVFTIAKAIRYAVDHGADVINMSFGTLETSKVLKDAVEYAGKAGVILVASAGNNNTETCQYPAAYDAVISVAATDYYDLKAPFSNYGSWVDVSAPGSNIVSPYPGGYYAVVSGTSFSAPIVAAEAALIRSIRAKDNKVRAKVHKGTIAIAHRNPGYGRKLGEGRIDVLLGVLEK